jgi:hypothetical protein
MPPTNRFQQVNEAKRSSSKISLFRLILLIFIVLLVLVFTLNYRYHIFTEKENLSNGFDSGDKVAMAQESGESRQSSSSTTVSQPSGGPRKKIAYAITVTKDGPFVDGALVLGYSAKKIHDRTKGYVSNYDAELIAFVVPGVVTSRPILEAYGWKLLERKLPVALDEIENKDYMQRMKDSGCCGADEFLKLWAYTLVEYHRVVHLDMDSVIFQNMVSYSYCSPATRVDA